MFVCSVDFLEQNLLTNHYENAFKIWTELNILQITSLQTPDLTDLH